VMAVIITIMAFGLNVPSNCQYLWIKIV
jgi:uncharacterized membrane protein